MKAKKKKWIEIQSSITVQSHAMFLHLLKVIILKLIDYKLHF